MKKFLRGAILDLSVVVSKPAVVTTATPSVISAPGGGGGGEGGEQPTPTPATTGDIADFNHDGIVNSVDFSIMLFFWKTQPPFSNPYVDINKDGRVDSVDFSILLYRWGNLRTNTLWYNFNTNKYRL